jgi:hypothetical protein
LKEPYEFYRTINEGCAGVEFAKLHPEMLLPSELERFMGRKPGSTNKPKVLSELANALSFVAVACTKSDSDYQDHVSLVDNFCIATDGQLSAGYPIVEELNSYPNFELLKKALSKCGKSLAITELDTGRLSVKGESLRAIVPCLDAGAWPSVQPDPIRGPIDESLVSAMALAGLLASETAERFFEASILLEANQVTGTNGHCIIQVWHGCGFPEIKFVIPKIFITALTKTKLKPVAIGVPDNFNSVTFYFEGGSWIKTLLYADKYPETEHIVGKPQQPYPIPEKLFEGIDAVMDFNEYGYIKLKENSVQSHDSLELGAQFEVPGLQGGKELVGKYMMLIAPIVKTIDMTSYEDCIMFTGDKMRGCLAVIK